MAAEAALVRAGWHAQLLAAFLVPFDADTFELFEVAAREKPHAPSSAWASAGLTLLAPFKVLGGELASASATPLTTAVVCAVAVN